MGVFRHQSDHEGIVAVFPTLVGVFLYDELAAGYRSSLPHARGGVSTVTGLTTVAGCLPHARGGVSRRATMRVSGLDVFPTLVGVFLEFTA